MSEELPQEATRAREILEALDNDRRLRILAVLHNAEDRLSFRQLSTETGIEGSSLSQHLDRLVGQALVLNFYEPGEGRDYSFYEISELGLDWLERIELVDPSSGEAFLLPA